MKHIVSKKEERKAKSFDWEGMHKRISDAQRALESGIEISAEESKRILTARAKLFALEPKEETAEDFLEVVEFLLAYETYGVESSFIREVFPLKELTPLPGTPAYILGVTNVRGKILSVIDIKKFFDLPEKGLTDLNKLIILQSNGMEFGILADVIVGVRSIRADGLQTTLPTLSGIRAEYLKGVTKERVVVLDALKLLSDDKLMHFEEPNV